MQTFWHELRKTLFVCQVPASSKVSSGYNGKQSHLSKRKCFNSFESWCYGAVKQFLYHGPRITSNYPKFLLSWSKQVTIGSHIKVCPGWPLVGKCWPVGGVRGSALQCLLYVGPLVHWSTGPRVDQLWRKRKCFNLSTAHQTQDSVNHRLTGFTSSLNQSLTALDIQSITHSLTNCTDHRIFNDSAAECM